MKYLIDTNILIHYLRQSPLADYIERTYQPLVPSLMTKPLISAVIQGELKSLSLQQNWTTDKDFDHLNNEFLNVIWLDPSLN